jgi:very-short-patch-repair endonuclease
MPIDHELSEFYDIGAPLYVRQPDTDYDHNPHEVWRWLGLSKATIETIRRADFAYALINKCESPIEITLGIELAAQMPIGYSLKPQFCWGKWRIDFAILCRGQVIAFIECDGAKFHSSPEQIDNDRRKDAASQAEDIRMLRFTGSEIYRDPQSCAKSIWDIVLS